MSRFLQKLRPGLSELPKPIALACPATRARRYRARSQLADDTVPKVPKVRTPKEEKDKNLSSEKSRSYIIGHAPGWGECLASDSEAQVSTIS